MGCDGGSIPRRDELVRVKKKAETKDKDSERHFQWGCCTVTQQPLVSPIVACHLGKLYNKMSLIEALLDKRNMPATIRHIKSLKDVIELKLTNNPAYKNDSSDCAPYICPLSGLEMSGKFRFVTLWTCGCVFSERAIKEISSKNCVNCQKPFEDNDIVILNGNEEDLVIMKQNMETRRQLQKKNKDKRSKELMERSSSSVSSKSSEDSVNGKSSAVPGKPEKKNDSLNEKQTKSGSSSLSLKRTGSLRTTKDDERAKKLKPEYSVAKDPNSSDVYKSIFTTHKSEKEQERAHWITYNPFYN